MKIGYSKVDFCRVANILKISLSTDEIDKTKREALVKNLLKTQHLMKITDHQ